MEKADLGAHGDECQCGSCRFGHPGHCLCAYCIGSYRDLFGDRVAPTLKFTAFGKQVLECGSIHYADARDDEAAKRIVNALNATIADV